MTERSRGKNVIKQCMANNIRISFDDRGSGDPLILLMGLGAPGSKWEPHMQVYEQHFRCICIDNRGSGLSDKPEADSYTIDQMADDTVGVLDALGIGKAHIHGISMGGAIAQRLAIRRPDRVRSLILTSTFPSVCVSFRRGIELLRDACGQLDGKTLGRLCQWMIYAFPFQEAHEDFMLADEAGDLDNPNPMPAHAYKAQCNAILRHDALAELPKIQAPTLIAAGDSDLFVPVWQTMRMFRAIPNAELYLCKNGGHVHHWEQLEKFNRATLDFLMAH